MNCILTMPLTQPYLIAVDVNIWYNLNWISFSFASHNIITGDKHELYIMSIVQALANPSYRFESVPLLPEGENCVRCGCVT